LGECEIDDLIEYKDNFYFIKNKTTQSFDIYDRNSKTHKADVFQFDKEMYDYMNILKL
jgi:hypothetical protein